MLLTPQTFYRKFGIRLLPQLPTPAMHDLKFLEAPRETIYHYLSFDGLNDGPTNDDQMLRNIRNTIPMYAPTTLLAGQGAPKRLGGSGQELLRDYLKSHRRLHNTLTPQSAQKDRDVPLVINYALLDNLYRYQASTFASYNRWRNIFATMVITMEQLAQTSTWQHYAFIEVPKTLPGIRQLEKAAEAFTQQEVRIFRESGAYMLLELWRWINGSETSPSVLDKIPQDKLHLMNFIILESGKWCVLNLGVLRSFFLKSEEKEHSAELVIKSSQHVNQRQLSMRLLRMYISLMETRNASIRRMLEQEKKAQADELKLQPVTTQEVSEATTDPQAAADQDPTQGQILAEQVSADLPELSIIDEGELENMPAADFARLMSQQDSEISQDLHQLEELSARLQQEETRPSVQEIIEAQLDHAPEHGVIQACERLAATGTMTAADFRRLTKLANNYKDLPAPFGEGVLGDFVRIQPEMLQISDEQIAPDSPTVLDKTMLKSKLNEFDAKYVKRVLHRDIANVVLSLQRAGIAVTSYKVEKIENILGGYEDHVVRLAPVTGMPSTLRLKLPIIREDGTYTTNGVKYRHRKQRGDLPIRKTEPNVVALTSYFGKSFITRGKRISDSYTHWLKTAAMSMAIDPTHSHLTDPICDNVFDQSLSVPRAYSAISQSLAEVTVAGRYRLKFDLKKATKDDNITTYPRSAPTYVGKDLQTGEPLFLTPQGAVWAMREGGHEDLGPLDRFIGADHNSAPLEYATARVFGKDIPVGVILALEMGLERLIAALRVTPRIVPAGERVVLAEGEYALQFSDETLVFSRLDEGVSNTNQLASMILGGFHEYHRSLRLFSAHSFDKRGAYVNLLDTNGIGVRYVRELDLMNQMFVDPITRDILLEMKEPTSWHGLLLRSCQMLLNDQHPDELDPAFMRIKGYERISGAIYTELIHALRIHNGALGKANSSVQLNPYAVWRRISEDPVKLQVSEINPLSTLKDQESVTYVGEGGRGKRSMTKDTRGYHPNDMGTISEATVDSSDVSVNIHTSADPQFTSLRGMSSRFDLNNPNPTSLLSTSALLAPASDKDDPKRVNFVSIQQKHAIACDGYHQHVVRTGYDTVLAHRVDSLYAQTAKQEGVVKNRTDKAVLVEYADGTTEGFEIGRRFGNSQGLTVAHEIVTPLHEGDKFAVGDPIIYNAGFFEPDFFNPKQIVWKNSVLLRTVLLESTQTHEDSSSLTARAAAKLTTRITKVKTIVISFEQAISNLVKQGDQVSADSVLCVIQDAVTANSKLFNEQSLETLKLLNAQTPRARVKGQVEKVEVFYHGEKDDMSDSVRQLCDWGDAQLRKQASAQGLKPTLGLVDSGFRIENNPLGLDQVAIRIYITSNVGAGVGDKGVFANQLKTCFGEILAEPMKTEDGQEIDAVFGYRSLEARIVESPMIMGTTATLLKLIGKRTAAIYRGTAK